MISAPLDAIEREANCLMNAMCNAIEMSVPMVSDYKVGNTYQETK